MVIQVVVSLSDKKVVEREIQSLEESIRGRTNAYKSIGQRYIKVTYKEFSDKIFVISVVDKAGGGQK